MTKVAFNVRADRNVTTNYETANGRHQAFAAAPFDMPSRVLLSQEPDRLVAEFAYALGAGEPTKMEQLGDARLIAYVGKISGRIMRLDVLGHSGDDAGEAFAIAVENLHSKQHGFAAAARAGQPLRQAAHYGVMGAIIPDIPKEAAKQALARGRRVTLDYHTAGGASSFAAARDASLRATAANKAGERRLRIYMDAEGRRLHIDAGVSRAEALELKALGARYERDDGTERGAIAATDFWSKLSA